MSGVEAPREQKEEHTCTHCMNTVVQTFNYFQEQIEILKNEKANLKERIRALEEENSRLKKKSASRKRRQAFRNFFYNNLYHELSLISFLSGLLKYCHEAKMKRNTTTDVTKVMLSTSES